MDDCTLKSLGVKPGKLVPAFSRNGVEYKVFVGSQIDTLSINYETSDKGASCSISNSNGGRTVPLKEGSENKVKVEVTAENGATKVYVIHVHRLSAKDATLSSLTTSISEVVPPFNSDKLEYFCTVSCETKSIKVIPTVDDIKAVVKVNGEKPDTVVSLNVGATLIEIEVTSPDGSNTKKYTLLVTRKQIPRLVRLADSLSSFCFECPVSLSPVYCPVATFCSGRATAVYSAAVIDLLARMERTDPVTGLLLDRDWRKPQYEMDQTLTSAIAYIPFANGESSSKVKYGDLGACLKDCSRLPSFEVSNTKYSTSTPMKHAVEVRAWEKQLHQIHDETNFDKLCSAADASLVKYFDSLPPPGNQSRHFNEAESPLDHLRHAAYCYATAIGNKGKDAAVHFKLAKVLEEQFFLANCIGVKAKEKASTAAAGTDIEAQDSSMEEECGAICALHGVKEGAPLAQQLQAIDKEYHQLLDKGQSDKADHVQTLYAWKSKSGSQGGAIALQASSALSVLGQAAMKYADALVLDDVNALYHFHYGRMLVAQGEFDAAVSRLETSLNWNSDDKLARVYLGLALSLRKGGPGTRLNEAVVYLLTGLEMLLQRCSELAFKHGEPKLEKLLQADNLLTVNNVHLLRGIVELGRLLSRAPKDLSEKCISSTDVLHTAALLASQALTAVARGSVYQQVEWVLLDAHWLLLEKLMSADVHGGNAAQLIGSRCERLSALIKLVTIPLNSGLLELQLKTCQMFAKSRPCSSRALCLLGDAQLACHDSLVGSSETGCLEDAQRSYTASIALENKPAVGDPPAELTGQKWWTETVKADNAEQKSTVTASVSVIKTPNVPPSQATACTKAAAGAKSVGVASVKPPGTRTAATKPAANVATKSGPQNGATATLSKPAGTSTTRPSISRPTGAAAKTAATAPTSSRTTPSRAQPPQKGAATTQPKPTTGSVSNPATRGQVSSPASTKSDAMKTALATDVSSNKDARSTEAPDPAAAAAMEPSTACSSPVTTADDKSITNARCFQPRLGLARVLSRNAANLDEAKKLYIEVIDMAPDQHSAYIESAELLASKDPMGAVDIYCRFPTSPNPSFDDAYIFGEVVRILMKMEAYDDPRLISNMIALGKVMGLSSLEKYVQTLEKKFKTNVLKDVYAGVNKMRVDDPEMVQFFKMKMWM